LSRNDGPNLDVSLLHLGADSIEKLTSTHMLFMQYGKYC
jgi:hypothetical protein